MFTSLLRVSALMALMASIGGESAEHSTSDGRGQPTPGAARPVSAKAPAIFDISAIATAAPESMWGREVMANDVCVREVTSGGFWVAPAGDGVPAFVRPAEGRLIDVRVGESVTIYGEVRLTTTPADERRVDRGSGGRVSQRMPYVHAYTVRPAWPTQTASRPLAGAQICSSMRHGR